MGGGRASYKLNFSSVGAVVNDTVCHSKSHGVESFRALRLIRIVADEPHYRMWRGRPRPRMYEPPQPSILVILSEVGSVAHDRSRAVERSLPAPQPMWGGHSCPPTYESSRTTWGQPPSPCPERSPKALSAERCWWQCGRERPRSCDKNGRAWLQPCRKAPTPNPSADEAQLFRTAIRHHVNVHWRGVNVGAPGNGLVCLFSRRKLPQQYLQSRRRIT